MIPVILIDDRFSRIGQLHGVKERNYSLLKTSFLITVNCYMVIITLTYKIDRNFLSLLIQDKITFMVFFKMKRHGILNCRNLLHPFDTNLLLFVKPNGVFIKVRKGYLWITTIVIKAFF